MALHGNSGTIKVGAQSFTTLVTGATTIADRGHLFAVTLIAGAQSTDVFSVTTALFINDPGTSPITLLIRELCGTVSGDPVSSQSTDSLAWHGWIPLGRTRNELRFLINNDSLNIIFATWGWASSDD